jgi:hypothetical protein
MADLMAFEIAFNAYARQVENPEQDTHFMKALHLTKRYENDIRVGLALYFESLVNKEPSARFLKYYVKMATRAGNILSRREDRILLYKRFLRWASSHQGKVREIYSSRDFALLKTLMQGMDREISDIQLMLGIAKHPSASGLVTGRRWTKKALHRMASLEAPFTRRPFLESI